MLADRSEVGYEQGTYTSGLGVGFAASADLLGTGLWYGRERILPCAILFST